MQAGLTSPGGIELSLQPCDGCGICFLPLRRFRRRRICCRRILCCHRCARSHRAAALCVRQKVGGGGAVHRRRPGEAADAAGWAGVTAGWAAGSARAGLWRGAAASRHHSIWCWTFIHSGAGCATQPSGDHCLLVTKSVESLQSKMGIPHDTDAPADAAWQHRVTTANEVSNVWVCGQLLT